MQPGLVHAGVPGHMKRLGAGDSVLQVVGSVSIKGPAARSLSSGSGKAGALEGPACSRRGSIV